MNTKICSKCKIEKSIDCFAINKTRKDGLQCQCKICHNQIKKTHYKNNKNDYFESVDRRRKELNKWLFEYKSTLSCKICGENHPAVLDFHHRNKTKKSFSVSDHRYCSKDKIIEEIAKCDILCSNCHRKLHWEELFSPTD